MESANTLGVGIIEGFFGPEWSWQSRYRIGDFLRAHNGDFYIYAPKRDSFLRKNWTQDHPIGVWQNLNELSKKCKTSGIAFGIGLSPFEIHFDWNDEAKNLLRDKILKLEELDANYLGLFFDDMKGDADLAAKQVEIVEFVRGVTKQKILFCPTYYSDDPILDRVFGQRPLNYVEEIGENLSRDIQILWTGNKVISKTISADDLISVTAKLKRKPLIWDNFFANDGPKQCNFLKLMPFEGRNQKAFDASSGWAMNLMNQPHLSTLMFFSSLLVLKKGMSPLEAYQKALQDLAGAEFLTGIRQNETYFLTDGLNNLSEKIMISLKSWLKSDHLYSADIIDWLDGKYNVGAECLTD